MPEDKKKNRDSLLQYSGMAIEFFLFCAIGAFIGNWLDNKLQWGFPLFTIILLLAGMLGALLRIYKQTTGKG